MKKIAALLTATVLSTLTLKAEAFLAIPYAGLGTGILINTSDNDNSGSYRGMPLEVFAGVGSQMDSNVYLGGEIFGNVGTMAITNTGLSSTQSIGASLMPGLVLGDHLLGFGRVGMLRNHFSWQTKTGTIVGAGLQMGLAREWDLRGEYNYIQYNGSLKTDQFIVGILYRFI